METVRADAAGLERAASTLNAGGVAVIPTDTVYGLAARPDRPAAVERLYAIKGREAKKPIALLAADAEAARAKCGGFSPDAARLAAKRWPGALTIVAGGEGVRVPNHGWTRELLRLCGGALRVTSANLSGRRDATDAPQALAAVGLSADLVVDGGVSPGGVASTVVMDAPDGLAVLRPGPKATLRTAMKIVRRSFVSRNPAAARACAELVAERLLAHGAVKRAVAARRPVAVYLASGDELDLAPFFAAARGAVLCAPRWNGESYDLVEFDCANPASLREGPHGIREPADGKTVPPRDVAVWLAPGLAFAADGARLGYGGGWYDRFFAAADPAAARLGICYPRQLVKSIPTEEHDLPCPPLLSESDALCFA